MNQNSVPAPVQNRNRTPLVIGFVVLALFALLAGIAGGVLITRTGSTSAAASVGEQASLAGTRTGQAGTIVALSPATVTDAPAEAPVDAPTVTVAPTVAPAPAPAPQPAPKPQPAPVTTPKPTTPPAPPAATPAITSFTTPENIDCHNGNFQNFSASWTTTNAVKTTISIDGPGVYKTYAANASDSLPFNCSTPHTFLLTAFGQDGHTVTKSITLQPRNVQPPVTNDDE